MRWSTLLCVCAILALAKADVESKLVHIAQGPVRGFKDQESGVFFFQSIPYASVPTGVNRFKAPLPPPTWMDTSDAVKRKIVCPQGRLKFPGVLNFAGKQEACLIASVYVPDTKETDFPVVVYVHGGAFQMGAGDMMVPSKLVAENNIIAVTFNYRVGIHGFLCLGTEDIPGNAGMKDQVAFLRWVQTNIASFGGNPDDVTIAGYSAGSAAVGLLMLSKSAEFLFNKVISESGPSIAQWAIQSDPLENAKFFARQMNFPDVDHLHALEHFYKIISYKLLTSDVFFNRTDSTFLFSPCVERGTKEEAFLDKSPVDILKSGDYRKLPILYGFANMEGLFRKPFFNSWKDKMNENFSIFLPADLKFTSVMQKDEVAKTVKEFYFGDKPVSEDTILAYVDYFSDVIFTYPMLRAVKLHVEAGHDQVYLYEFSFVDDNTPFVPHTTIKGANHCAQTGAVFGRVALSEGSETKEFSDMSLTMGQLWGSFIKTGYPVPAGSSVPEWPPVVKDWSPYMSLGNTISVVESSLLERRTRFWDDIYSRHYRDPVPPSTPSSPGLHTEL